jgi:gluconokinase
MALALDIGTSSTRAALYDSRGAMLPDTLAVRKHTPATDDHGASELDPEAILGEVCAVLDEALAAAPGARVAVAGTGALWHSLVGVGGDGRAATPIYTWADTRSAEVLPELASRLDVDALYARAACPLHSSYVLPKLLWLRLRRPETFACVHRWMSPAEYVQLRLLGETACGDGMASATGLYDQAARAWYPPALEAAGVGADALSPLVAPSEPVGRLRSEYAARWPALTGAVWYPAVGDGACSNYGSGAARPGTAALNYGTSGAIRTVVAEPVPFPRGLWLYRVDPHRLLLGGAVSNAGNIYAWLLRTLGLSPEEAEAHMLSAEPGASGLDFVPHLAGERSPGWRPDATGSIAGLRLDSSREEILQAGMEGVLIELSTVHNMLSDTVDIKDLVVSGGAYRKSEALRRNTADALGRQIRVCLEIESSARGAALLAMGAHGVLDAAAVPARMSEPTQPDPARHAIYAALERRRTALRIGYEGFPTEDQGSRSTIRA